MENLRIRKMMEVLSFGGPERFDDVQHFGVRNGEGQISDEIQKLATTDNRGAVMVEKRGVAAGGRILNNRLYGTL